VSALSVAVTVSMRPAYQRSPACADLPGVPLPGSWGEAPTLAGLGGRGVYPSSVVFSPTMTIASLPYTGSWADVMVNRSPLQ